MSTSASDSKHGLSEEELKKITAAKQAYMEAAANGSTNAADLAREYHDLALDILLGDHVEGGVVPGPKPGCGPNPDPNNDHVKDGGKGWGGDTASPELWKVVPMKDDPSQYKVVDDDGTNIAHKFQTEAEAKTYVTYHQCKKEQGLPIPTPEPGPGPTPEPHPPATGTDGPYPVVGEKMNYSIKRAVRHYASGAADDETIEANVKNIQHRRHQFVVDVGVPQEMEHDDNLSLKLGGTHMGTGWFDHSFSIYKGRTGLGKEEDHPSTDLFVEEGAAIGDLRGKRIKIASTYDADTNHTELWHNSGEGGWKKDLEGTDVGGFNPKASSFECQLRIDGFKKGDKEGKPPEPEIFDAFVSAI